MLFLNGQGGGLYILYVYEKKKAPYHLNWRGSFQMKLALNNTIVIQVFFLNSMHCSFLLLIQIMTLCLYLFGSN